MSVRVVSPEAERHAFTEVYCPGSMDVDTGALLIHKGQPTTARIEVGTVQHLHMCTGHIILYLGTM